MGETKQVPDIRSQMSRVRAHPDLMFRKIKTVSKRLLSPSFAFFEANHDVSNTLLVISTGRSGSTWLGELLSRAPNCRLICEVFKSETSPLFVEFSRNLYLDEGQENPKIDLLIQRALSGKIRSKTSDQFNHSRRPTYRVLKEIYTTNLLPHISDLYPNVPIIYLIRHPLAVAWSWTQLRWGALGQFTHQNELMDKYFVAQREMIMQHSFVTNVYSWCLQNTVPIHSSRRNSLLVVFYEDLARRPDEELHRIELFLHRHSPGHWREWKPDLTEIDRTSVAGSVGEKSGRWSVDTRVDWWQREVPPNLVSAGLEVVTGFGLDWIYGDDPMPKIGPEDLPIGPDENRP
jgi:hypothetical protein